MMTCAGLLAVATAIFLVGTLLVLALIPVALAILLLSLLTILAAVIFLWKHIYPWLKRMGRWAARPANIIFLFIVVVVLELVLRYALDALGIAIPTFTIAGITLTIIGLGLLLLALFLLLLAIVVWLVRLWRYGWPRVRNAFWDLSYRVVGVGWKILVGIPLGVVWFFYHPPLRWLLSVVMFYLRGIAAAVAWLLYNPPFGSLARAGLFLERLLARVLAWLVYNPPIRWFIQVALFILMLIAHIISTMIDHIAGTEFMRGVKDRLARGLTVERESYQDYKYAHNDRRSAA